MLRKPELLSPAGDMESLRFAVAYGADAVYLGGTSYGMRSGATNFDAGQLCEAVRFAHRFGRRVYLTLNTVPTNAETDVMGSFIEEAAEAGVDAFIIADLGVLSLAKRRAPRVPVHFSTQAGIVNYAAAGAAYELGASRVVLARELSLEDIAVIRAKTPPELELEAFVHGAMCVSFSGRCLLSRYLSGRDSNRGQCAQPCRWKWDIRPSESEENWFTLGEEQDSAYILNADDLCMAPFLGAVCEAGVDSLKIEGRAKSFYYVASVTSAYRRALDTYLRQGRDSLCPEDVLAELMKTSHRHYSTGFYFGPQGATENRKSGSYQRAWDVAGVVENWDEGMAACTQRGKFEKGDLLEILTPGGETLPVKATFLLDENGEELTSAPCSGMEFYLPMAQEVPPLSILRKKVCVNNDGKEKNLC